MSKFCSVLEIFIHKVSILAKNGESGVQISLYISRTVNATENLIWYSESTENFLSCTSHQIFVYSSSSSGRIFGSEIGNFWAFLSSFRAFSLELLEKTRSEVRLNRYEAKVFSFCSKVCTWPNSKSYHVKSEIWWPSTSSSLMTSWKFFDRKFLDQNFFSNFQNGSIRKVIRLKWLFEKFFRFQPIMRSSWLGSFFFIDSKLSNSRSYHVKMEKNGSKHSKENSLRM